MRHRVTTKKLSKSITHRLAMKRNAMTSIIRYGQIQTTLAKAKFYQPTLERLITRAKNDGVHNRRMVAKYIQDKAMLHKLFVVIAPIFSKRNGGYTRIVKMGPRFGDSAEMAVFQFVEDIHQDLTAAEHVPSKEKKQKKTSKSTSESKKNKIDDKDEQTLEAENTASKEDKPAADDIATQELQSEDANNVSAQSAPETSAQPSSEEPKDNLTD